MATYVFHTTQQHPISTTFTCAFTNSIWVVRRDTYRISAEAFTVDFRAKIILAKFHAMDISFIIIDYMASKYIYWNLYIYYYEVNSR